MTPPRSLGVMQQWSGLRRKRPSSTKGIPEAVEASKAETSARDVGQAGVKETKEVVEASQDAGKEEQPELQTEQEEPQPK